MKKARSPRLPATVNLAILALDLVWIGLCAWGGLPLAEEAYTWITAGWLVLGMSGPVAALFIPELPRLPGEKRRLSDADGILWAGIVLTLIGGALLGWNGYAFSAGKELPMESLRLGAPLVTAYALVGHILALRCAMRCVCWNIDGVTVRTGLGRVHHFSWREVVAVDRYSHRDGSGSFRACGRGYSLPGGQSGAKQFARYAHKRRKALGLRF